MEVTMLVWCHYALMAGHTAKYKEENLC
jgi:hypothetical protein